VITTSVEHISKRYRIGKGAAAMMLPTLIPARVRRREQTAPREIWALRDVSFDASAGEILGIIGANGAGKSTLLKVLARITPPTEGRARVRGRVVPLLELGAAFQAEATGRENVFLNAALYGIPRQVVNRRMQDIFEFAELEKFIDTPVKRYSSGMYLRLAFSVAINMEPDVLLADEVLAVGDIGFQERCLTRVEEAGEQGLTVLFVSHDMAAVRRLCDRVMWINAGEIVDIGDPEEVVSRYEESTWALLADEADQGSHVNELGEVLSTGLYSPGGDGLGSIRVSDEVHIRVRLRIKAPNICVRCVLVVTAEGVAAFRTAQPHEFETGEPGVYVFTARVPPHLLSDTVYTVKTGVFLVDDARETALMRHHALTFRVYDTDETRSARGTYRHELPGVLRPRLDWSVDREDLTPRSLAASGRGRSL
jgi:homopolymeric O-antigen transport system ATP-binding protein